MLITSRGTALETDRLAVRTADDALAADDLTNAFLSVYERRWRAAFDLDLRTSDLVVTVVKNGALLPLWLVLRMIAKRSRTDLEFAVRCSRILAGVVPSHRGMSPDLAVKTMLQPPDFWVRNRIEASEVLAALLGSPQALATRPGRDLPREYEYAIGWALDLMVKTWRVSCGLLDAYGVPWAADGRLTTRGHTASPGREGRLSDTLPRPVIGAVQESS